MIFGKYKERDIGEKQENGKITIVSISFVYLIGDKVRGRECKKYTDNS